MKLRAWVEGEGRKRMIKWEKIDAIEWCNDKLWHSDGKSTLLGNLVLMQNTGILDKNKKDIYQGDIVAIDLGISDASFINGNHYEVIWDKSNARYTLVHAKRDGDDFGVYTRKFGLNCDSYEIIGNIYQNPELTK